MMKIYQCNSQQMCNKAILKNGGTLKPVPDCYNNLEMCNKEFIFTLMC